MRNLEDYTVNYYNQPFEDIQVLYRKRKVLELIKKQNHRTLLEIGCGLDPLFNHFNEFDKLVILEPSNAFFENAVKQADKDEELTDKVDIINGLLEDSVRQLQEYNFDFILVSCLLHEIEDTALFLANLRQIAREDTIIHIDVPNAFSFHRVLALEMGLIESVFEMSASNLKFQQQRVFDLKSLTALITSAGFTVIDSGSFFVKPFMHKQMSGLIEHGIIDYTVLDGLYNMVKFIPEMGSEIYAEFKIHD